MIAPTSTPPASAAPTVAPPLTDPWAAVARVVGLWRRHSPRLTLVMLVALSLAIGWLDRATGWEVSLFVVYAVPIVLAVWLVNFSAGLLLALACGPVWWLANHAEHPYQTAWGYHWAMVNRAIYFTSVAVAAGAVRKKHEADAAQIRMLQEMRRMELEIVSAGEHEQQRIGQDLHDGLCQQLAAIGCAARALADDLEAQALPEARDAEKIEAAIRQSVAEARSLARGIFPVQMDRHGLSAALADLAAQTSRFTALEVRLVESAEVQIEDPEVAMHLFRIAQEAVANAVRHSGARAVEVSLQAEGGHVELRVEDDGRGLPASEPASAEGMGLRTMRYRAHALGAEFAVEPRAGGGTAVCCRVRAEIQAAPICWI